MLRFTGGAMPGPSLLPGNLADSTAAVSRASGESALVHQRLDIGVVPCCLRDHAAGVGMPTNTTVRLMLSRTLEAGHIAGDAAQWICDGQHRGATFARIRIKSFHFNESAKAPCTNTIVPWKLVDRLIALGEDGAFD